MKKRTKEILKVSIALVVIIAISVVLFFVGKALGVTDIDSLHALIKSFGVWGWLVFLIIQVVTTVLLCFIPATSMTFTALGILLYGANWKAFVLVFSGIVISSVIMDLIGRFGGSKLIIKLVGEDDYKKALDLVKTKGEIYLPIMYLLPVFPDDALCMCYGACKGKFWLHLIYIFLCRGIGCATIVFGVNILPTDLIDNIFVSGYFIEHLWEYITMITVIAFWVYILFTFARKIDLFIKRRKELKNGNNTK